MTFDDLKPTCAWIAERIDAFVDDDPDLSVQERDAVGRHLDGCAACRAEVDAARRIASELHAFERADVPASVVERAERAIASPGSHTPATPRTHRLRSILAWAPAAVAAAGLAGLIATARWSDVPRTEPIGGDTIAIERAAAETVLALGYVNKYARYTGRIVEDDVIGKRVIGTMERAIESSQQDVIDRDVTPPIKRAMEKSGIIETKPGDRRS